MTRAPLSGRPVSGRPVSGLPVRAVLAGLLMGVLPAAAGAAPDAQNFQQIERGRYLTVMGDCAACHTAPGGAAFAGGRPIETPFGTLLASNITPDRATGIGTWTDDEFVDTLQKGRGHDGKHIYPAMPYTYYTHVTRADALAIRAYLASVEPVRHPVVSNQLPFPMDVRASLGAWNDLYFRQGEFKPVIGKSDEWNRGAYLVTGLEHCGMCHTPKNLAGADEDGRALQGYAVQGWFAPNITNDARRGLGSWSVADIAQYLKTGHNRVAAASGPMAEEVAVSSSNGTDADLRAIAVFLKDQPGQGGEAARPADAGQPAMKAGAAIYADACSACHTPGGAGVPGLFPTLAGAPGVQSTDAASVVRVILRGARSVATAGAPTGPAMPSFGWQLDDAQVAAVATFVRNAWGNAAPAVSEGDVAAARKSLAARTE